MSARPNFLLFVTDQQRADHLGCAGEPVLRTPALDALAAAGTRFTEFHVATPICQPNRASLMTGRLPSVHGVSMNGRDLPHRELTFVEQLRRAGWRTALVGKAHLQNITDTPPAWPAAGERRAADEAIVAHPGPRGQELASRWRDDPAFDVQCPYYGFESVQLTIGHGDDQQGHWRRWLRAQDVGAEALIGPRHAIPTPGLALAARGLAWRTRLPQAWHPTQWIAERCIHWLGERARDGQPFFVQCSFPDPHHPFTPPGPWWGRYTPAEVALPPSFGAALHDAPPAVLALRRAAAEGRQGRIGYGAFAATEQELREAIALNHGNIGFIDEAVGRVCASLAALGLDENTVVAFTSDHGDLMGDRGLLLKGGLHYRSLTRVPFIWRDTAAQRASQQRSSTELAQTIDIAPTVLERAGVGAAHGVQGRSLLAAMQPGAATPGPEAIVIEEEGQRRDFDLAHRLRLRTLLTRRHRLTLYADEPWGELYDLERDPHELHNLWNDAGARALRGELAHGLALAMMKRAEQCPYPAAAA